MTLDGEVRCSTGRGGGVDRAPPKLGGSGFGERAQLTGPLISYYDVWRRNFFRTLKMVFFFPTKHMANDVFSETPLTR